MHHSVPNSIFNCSKRLPERCGDLGVAHPLKVCHFQWDSLLFRQLLQSFLDRVSSIGKDEGIALRRRVRRLRIHIELVGSRLLPACRSNRVDCACPGNRQEPRDGLSS